MTQSVLGRRFMKEFPAVRVSRRAFRHAPGPAPIRGLVRPLTLALAVSLSALAGRIGSTNAAIGMEDVDR